VVIAAGWWAQHWSEVAAVVLVASFIGLVGQAVRSSLFLGQTAVSRRAKKRAEVSAGTAGSEELRVAMARLERRLAQLESRLSESRSGADRIPLLEQSDSLEQRIEALSAEGVPASEIAKIVEEPIGRVELILNLRRTASRG
jgi:TolA-binding protein